MTRFFTHTNTVESIRGDIVQFNATQPGWVVDISDDEIEANLGHPPDVIGMGIARLEESPDTDDGDQCLFVALLDGCFYLLGWQLAVITKPQA